MRKPNLFLVGAPKCGTTALHGYLDRHPDIFMSVRKEPKFFGADFERHDEHWKHIGDLEEYLSLFAGARHEAILGESTTNYIYSTTAAEEIKAFNADAKIVIMLRSPVDVMYAMYHEQCYNGQEDLASFEEAIEAEEQRRRGARLPSSIYILESVFYRHIVRYHEHVTRYLDCFGESAVHVVVFDDFKADTAGVYREILSFLGVDADFQPSFEVANASHEIRSAAVRRFLRRPPAALVAMGKAMQPIARPIYRRLFELNTRPAQRDPMKAETRKRLQDEIRPDVDKLGVLLDRDLTHWYAG